MATKIHVRSHTRNLVTFRPASYKVKRSELTREQMIDLLVRAGNGTREYLKSQTDEKLAQHAQYELDTAKTEFEKLLPLTRKISLTRDIQPRHSSYEKQTEREQAFEQRFH